MENWLGQIQIKVDEKGRFALPASALDFFPHKDLVLSLGVYDKKPYLELLSVFEWSQKLEILKKLPAKSPKTKAYKRFLLSGSAKVSLDKQNRLTLPAFQRERIQILKEAVMISLDGKLELWSAPLWNEVSDGFMNDFEGLEEWVSEQDDSLEEDLSDVPSAA